MAPIKSAELPPFSVVYSKKYFVMKQLVQGAPKGSKPLQVTTAQGCHHCVAAFYSAARRQLAVFVANQDGDDYPVSLAIDSFAAENSAAPVQVKIGWSNPMADISRQPDSAAQPLDPVLVEGALFFRPEEGGEAEIAQGAKAAAENLQQKQEQQGAQNYRLNGRDVAHRDGAWSFRLNHSNAGRTSEAGEAGSTGADLGVQLRSINVRTTRNRNTPRTSWERQDGSTLDSSSSPDSASPFGTASVTATEAGDSLAVYQRAVAKLVAFGFNGKEINDHARRLIALGAGGVVLFARNFSDPRQLASFCADLKRAAFPRRLLIMVDQEGGRVTRLGPPFTCIPAARTIGFSRNPNLARAAGRVLGRELRSVHIDIDLAPVLDVDTNPDNPVIGARSFSRDPGVVSQMGYELIRGMQGEGVAACVKHYPGHGDTSIDSHLALPYSSHDLSRLESVELVPFARAAVDADVAAVMVAHVAVPALATWQPPPSMEYLPESVKRVISPRWDLFSPYRRRKQWDEARREAEATLGLPRSLSESDLRGSGSAGDKSSHDSSRNSSNSCVTTGADTVKSPSTTQQPHQQQPIPPTNHPAPSPNPSPLAAFGSSLPATLSPGALSYLRMEIGFEGAVLSDCLEMGAIVKHVGVGEAAVLAVAAGVDMVLVCHTETRQAEAVDALAHALQSGRLSVKRFRAASRAVDALARVFWRPPPPEGSEVEERYWEEEQRVVGCREHREVVAEIEHEALARGEGDDWKEKERREGGRRCTIS
ncbi:unnamed protein product [Closterium sp. NIES-65]|nr:unnamed protein product [Closterium sp. NIES-65]